MTVATTPRTHRQPSPPAQPVTTKAPPSQWPWLSAGLVLAFLVPFLLTDLTSINRDLYYGVFIGFVFGFVGLWLRFGSDAPRALLTRNWRRGVLLGLGFIGLMIGIVLKEPSTAHPAGLDFAAAIAWRGVVYGFADGVILSAFPIVAVFAAFSGKQVLERWRGKAAVGALALAVSLLFTAVYHLGYSDFRGEKVRKPLAGDVIWSVPTLTTLSPLAAPITHAGLHVTAVVHSYDTDTFLPPHATPGVNKSAQPWRCSDDLDLVRGLAHRRQHRRPRAAAPRPAERLGGNTDPGRRSRTSTGRPAYLGGESECGDDLGGRHSESPRGGAQVARRDFARHARGAGGGLGKCVVGVLPRARLPNW
jgi:hypothetical protein